MVDHLIGSSLPDPARAWASSGELGTAGARIVDVEAVDRGVPALVEREARRLARQFERVAAVSRALADDAPEDAIERMLEESGALEDEGRSSEASAWAEAAGRLGLDIGSERTAEALRRAARCARAEGRLADAAERYVDAFGRARDRGRVEDAVIAATGRGNVAVDRGRWSEAELWYQRGLDLLSRSDTRIADAAAVALRWRLFQNLGITARERGALDDSAAWYVRAEAASMELRDPAADVEVQNGIGQLELARGEARRAEVRFRRALDALDVPGSGPDPVRVAIRVNLGEALLAQGRNLEAGDEGREAEAEAIAGPYLGRLPEVYRLLARAAHARGEEEAFVLLERALGLVRTQALPPMEEARTLMAYAELRAERGETDLAAGAREEANRILRTLEATAPEPMEDGDD